MRVATHKFSLLVAALALTACASQGQATYDPDFQKQFILGEATDQNIALQSIRAADVPNSKGLTGQSGERAVAAIERLNTGERAELSDLSESGVGSASNE